MYPSGNRWYVIEVESRRQVPPPCSGQVRWALEQVVLHAGATQLRTQALKSVPLSSYGLTGVKPDGNHKQMTWRWRDLRASFALDGIAAAA